MAGLRESNDFVALMRTVDATTAFQYDRVWRRAWWRQEYPPGLMVPVHWQLTLQFMQEWGDNPLKVRGYV